MAIKNHIKSHLALNKLAANVVHCRPCLVDSFAGRLGVGAVVAVVVVAVVVGVRLHCHDHLHSLSQQ